MRRVLGIAAAFTALSAAPAAADGGQSIAGATAVVYGQQQFGNTANGYPAPRRVTDCPLDSWWSLAVTAGDRITIDWEADKTVVVMAVFDVGTTDYNVDTFHDRAYADHQDGGSGKSELVFPAQRSGSMPLLFEGQDPDCGGSIDAGPYNFTAYVKHGVKLSVPQRAKLRRKATLKVGVHNPEGGAINDPALKVAVQVKAGKGSWRKVGRASVQTAVARVHLKIPRKLVGHKVRVRARATGAEYLTETSSPTRVRVLAE